MRAVLDTNILISALIVDGKSKSLFKRAVDKQFVLITPQQIVAEFQRITKDSKIRKYVDRPTTYACFLEGYRGKRRGCRGGVTIQSGPRPR